ncbi:MAG: tryptophan synthase subunit beta [Candidatus Aminicenantales bacterium]
MKTSLKIPKSRYFGEYGGRFVPEMLIPALEELEKAYFFYRDNGKFQQELEGLMRNYSGRPTPLYLAENLTRRGKGCRIYLKLESLNHTGAHKMNNVLGQALLARRMGKTCLIAETGAGQHGLATAAAAARFGLKCRIFMGEVDMKRQYPNVFFMKLTGAEIIPVKDGTRTLKDAVNAALKYWIEHLKETHYLLGSTLGPFPYPVMVRDFQSVIGREVRAQLGECESRLPDILVACVGGGSNSIGLFYPFLKNKDIRLYAVEAGGRGPGNGNNAVRFGIDPKKGIVQGYRSYFILDEEGQVLPTHSISAGLDYAGIGPELADLHDTGRICFDSVTDEEALSAFQTLCREEGILPALESAHAVAYALKIAGNFSRREIMVVNISGRGEKDLFIAARELDPANWMNFLKGEVKNGQSD